MTVLACADGNHIKKTPTCKGWESEGLNNTHII